jgi:hypothetical protein
MKAFISDVMVQIVIDIPHCSQRCFHAQVLHVFPTLFALRMSRINEVALEKVWQHGAPAPSLHYNFFVTNSQGFLSFFPFFFLPLFLAGLHSYFYSQFIGTIQLLASINTFNWFVTLEKVKVVPHLGGFLKPHFPLRPLWHTAVCLELSSLIPPPHLLQKG